MQNILITGGAGFIGSYLVPLFLNGHNKLHVLDDFSTGAHENLPLHPDLIIHKQSILDKAGLDQFRNIDLVIHLASIVGMKKVKMDAELTYATATKGTENVLDATGYAPVVLFSSSAVYGMTSAAVKVAEATAVSRDSLLLYDGGIPGYATGKWAMEQMGLERADKGREVLIVRPFNVVGLRQLSLYGMVVPGFVQAAVNQSPLTVYGSGSQSRCFSDVEAFSGALLKLIEHKSDWNSFGNVMNMGTDESTTIQSLAETTIRLSGSSSVVQYIPFEQVFKGQVDVQGRIPDAGKFRQLIGDMKWPAIEEIVNKIIAGTLKNQ